MNKTKQSATKEEKQTIQNEEKPEELTIKNEKSQVRTEADTMQAIKDSKVLYLSLSGGWGQTRHWIKQWEKDNKIDEDPDGTILDIFAHTAQIKSQNSMYLHLFLL